MITCIYLWDSAVLDKKEMSFCHRFSFCSCVFWFLWQFKTSFLVSRKSIPESAWTWKRWCHKWQRQNLARRCPVLYYQTGLYQCRGRWGWDDWLTLPLWFTASGCCWLLAERLISPRWCHASEYWLNSPLEHSLCLSLARSPSHSTPVLESISRNQMRPLKQ